LEGIPIFPRDWKEFQYFQEISSELDSIEAFWKKFQLIGIDWNLTLGNWK
jgi:hypothetical protein